MKNNKFNLGILSTVIFLQSCATIIKSPNTLVTFQGNPSVHTKVITPYGSTVLRHGTSSMLIHNNRNDIPIQIICNKKAPIQASLPTNYSVGAGIFGNLGLMILWIVPGVIGFVVDVSGDVAYVPQTPFNVSSFCD